jgi:hypothetical protein
MNYIKCKLVEGKHIPVAMQAPEVGLGAKEEKASPVD